MDETQRDLIIDDLLKKEPSGTYTDQQLFDLGLRHRVDVEHYLCRRFYNVTTTYNLGRKKATVTRRSKRLWSRISVSVARVVDEGGPGVYKITERYQYVMPPLGYIFARDKEEALLLAQMFFGFLVLEQGALDITYIEHGGPDKIKKYNDELLVRYSAVHRESSKKVVEEQKKLDRAEMMLKYLQNFSPDSFKS